MSGEIKSTRKNKIQNPYNMTHMYKDYIKDKSVFSPYWVTADEFYRICDYYFKAVSRKLIYESKTYVLPFRLGHFTIVKKKPANFNSTTLTIDWAESRRLGRWIRYINDHTAGFKYKFFWSKKSCMVVNREFYRLVMSRTNKRELAKVIKSGNVDYLEIK